MRLFFVIPHFFRPLAPDPTNRSSCATARDERLQALTATITALHEHFGNAIYGLDHFNRVAWQAQHGTDQALDIVVCTTGSTHLLDDLPALRPLCRHHAVDTDPMTLGFECHRLLKAMYGRYDYYGYIEDDIVIDDGYFFHKRRAFDHAFGFEALLQPNRYETRLGGAVHKLYVDYHIRPGVTAPYQNVEDRPCISLPFLGDTMTFERTCYPSAGCFFLNNEQLRVWMESPSFEDRDVSYMSSLDSAATLSVMKTFRIYKPVLQDARFLEVRHASPRWIPSITEGVRLMPHSWHANRDKK